MPAKLYENRRAELHSAVKEIIQIGTPRRKRGFPMLSRDEKTHVESMRGRNLRLVHRSEPSFVQSKQVCSLRDWRSAQLRDFKPSEKSAGNDVPAKNYDRVKEIVLGFEFSLLA